jgi:hypothetical protein
MEGNKKRGIKRQVMKEETEVGKKKGGTNAAAAATYDNRPFTNSRSWSLSMHRFRIGIIYTQVASAR